MIVYRTPALRTGRFHLEKPALLKVVLMAIHRALGENIAFKRDLLMAEQVESYVLEHLAISQLAKSGVDINAALTRLITDFIYKSELFEEIESTYLANNKVSLSSDILKAMNSLCLVYGKLDFQGAEVHLYNHPQGDAMHDWNKEPQAKTWLKGV